ncbi:neuropeptide F receptor-like [Brachionus plicatilis]|uniref:Neuropeptide F receptor-like n=1 Tax=Brachionus plicatilis TaxID=10195 RepID=A0A3M7RSB6_BRAPC|nr:neuropeptide F receptor-like [Brachionus plicatilis]
MFHLEENSTFSEAINFEETIDRPLMGFMIVVHTFIIAFGIFGNSLVIYLVVCNIRLRNVRNAFMLNLTLSNLLLVTICTPSFLFSIIFPQWTMGIFWCKFLHSIQIVIMLVSAFSIMMIAIDRWMFVVYSRSRQFKKQDTTVVIIFIWILAILLSMPTFWHRTTKELYDENIMNLLNYRLSSLNSSLELPFSNINDIKMTFFQNNRKYCVENWSDTFYKRLYIMVLFFLEFVLPCLSMFITYFWIVSFLKRHDDKMSHHEQLRRKLIQKERPHQKNCRLLSALCLTFIICCLPLSLFNIKAEFDIGKMSKAINHNSFQEKEIYSPLTILTTLEELNTIISPLLYGWMNHNFRYEIREKIKILRKKYGRVQNCEPSSQKPQKCLQKAQFNISA